MPGGRRRGTVHDLILTGGHVLDPANNLDGPAGVGIADGRIAEVGRLTAGARRTIDVTGRHVLPGVIDTHAHLSRHFGSAEGHAMVAETGVVTVLDLAGDAGDLTAALAARGAGLNVACLHALIPDRTVSGAAPSGDEIDRAVDRALAAGALGIKLLGGHYPLTPDATARAMAAATAQRCYLAFHVGTTETGSDILGLAEALDLAGDRRIHIAHVNSYCRGQETGDAVGEAQRALDLLHGHPAARSESYLSVYNGTSAHCRNGVPDSGVTRTCLRLGGYDQTTQGLEAAIRDGYARIHAIADGRVRLAEPDAGLAAWNAADTDVAVSFPVNHVPSAILLATARRDGRFAIDALSTDGGSIPRNFLVRHGLMLVQMGAWTPRDFVVKTSLNPARMLGISTKGHLAIGADADVTVVDLAAGRAVWSVAAGRVVLDEGRLVGRRGAFITTPRGAAALRGVDAPVAVVHAEGWT
jgi:hypothetical protein